MPTFGTIIVAALFAVLIITIIINLIYGTIPNYINCSIIVLFIIGSMLTNSPLSTVLWGSITAAIIFAITFIAYKKGTMGSGLAKYITCVSLWFGWSESLIHFLLFASLFGGIFILIHMPIAKLINKTTWSNQYNHGQVPYAIAVSTSVFFCYSISPFFQELLSLKQNLTT